MLLLDLIHASNIDLLFWAEIGQVYLIKMKFFLLPHLVREFIQVCPKMTNCISLLLTRAFHCRSEL